MVAILFKAGDQVPVTWLLEVVGNVDKLAPAQMGATAVKAGVTIGLTAIVIVVVFAHCPLVGLKV